jgi:uncharacterized repeat protein (TIGR03803 family)
LYGTTYNGGANDNGTVFKITAGGKLTTLHSFLTGLTAPPLKAGWCKPPNGNFYGTLQGVFSRCSNSSLAQPGQLCSWTFPAVISNRPSRPKKGKIRLVEAQGCTLPAA